MTSDTFKLYALRFLKRWWCSLLMLPFVIYAVHQVYWTLKFNIFFAISYGFPFPINFINVMVSNFLLIVHEAGHTFFSVFGSRTITILGGSLFEVILPFIILVYFIFNKKKTGIQLSLYLTGCSFIKVAFYAADGGARQLPLIGGLSKEAHDWYNLLSGWNMLAYDHHVGTILASVGILCFLAALFYPLFYKKYEVVKLNLNI